MKVNVQGFRPSRIAMMVAAAGLLPFAAAAQGTSNADMQARYQADMQRCSSITDSESRRTCQREAGAALQEARRNRLVNHSDTQANASARCARLPAVQRADCERLMTDSSAVEHGSVSGGGVLRELSITVPADQATSGSYTGQTGSHSGQTGSYSGYTGTTSQPSTPPSSGYGAQPTQPAPAPTYGTQPAPAPHYGTQPAPATAPYGTVPAR